MNWCTVRCLIHLVLVFNHVTFILLFLDF